MDSAILGQGMEPVFTGSDEEILEWLNVKENYVGALWVRIGASKRVVPASAHLFDAKKRGWVPKIAHKCLTEDDVRRIFREELEKFSNKD